MSMGLEMGKKLTTREAAAYVGIKKSTLQKYRTEGTGPRFIKLGKVVSYDQIDCDRWIEEHKFSSVAEAANPSARRRQRHHVAD